MTTPNELSLVEKPILHFMESMGYRVIGPDQHPSLRARENEVLFKPLLVKALGELNDIDEATALAIYNELAGLSDNKRWVDILRGNYSRKVAGEQTHRTIRLVDFKDPQKNHWAVTSQLRVQGEVVRKPDVVVYLNGIPVVVIEAKSPVNPSQNSFDAIEQIRMYESDVPRLFAPNLFNIATNDVTFLYGATGAPSEFWSRWRDPWPRSPDAFSDETEKGLYSLLEPARLLDILAHFIVFETRDGKTIKKVCRYQQYRAVNKMVQRVIDGEHRAGLIWHTQGSGKSLTMVFAALKLKFHRGLSSQRLQNPNLLIITDRIDLHDQISATFVACGLPNPVDADSIDKLQQNLVPGVSGRTVLSTIFKFNWEDERLKSQVHAQRLAALRDLEVAGSENWILMVDECHRTQEKDLGAYLRAILPKATRFGFTGTPVKKNDHDTFTNFGAKGERYLDKYGIDDAVADGATVPILYQGRMTEWHLHAKELDVVFDQWFVDEPDGKIEELKRRGVTKGDLARFEPRIQLIALDLWTHFQKSVQPDGFKAQIVAIDRLACVAYKKALDSVIANTLVKTHKLSPEDAQARATAMSKCVYSPAQHDQQKHPELVEFQLDDQQTKDAISDFVDPASDLKFLIVCNKLLTGFDAPIEQAMYLDNPLTDHNLLQAIARTNRRYGTAKAHGLIVDYIGVSKKLSEALSAYRKEDVASAMKDHDVLADKLKLAHREVMDLVKQVPRTDDPDANVKAVIAHLATEDRWYIFRSKADAFLKAYQALTPDPRVLPYQVDLKHIASCIPYGLLRFENKEETDWKKYSQKVRQMLDEHLEVTGLKTVCKLRSLTDPKFWDDFESPQDIEEAAVRKLSELKKETTERAAKNPARYEKFSDRIKELIDKFNQGLLEAQQTLDFSKQVAQALTTEDQAHQGTGLSERAFSIHAILESFAIQHTVDPQGDGYKAGDTKPTEPKLSALQKAALDIDALYASDESAPPHWQDKSQLRKELRGQVRRLVKGLGLDGWAKEVPSSVEHYALQHYRKPPGS
ncbi:MAG: HsdR family type I site-specific deoxyribonuclease [Myxococcota bacterium]|nr:HsdR family type I site-specific deoxyribonuclease [Myxococcota bacterium]